jgi:hypothetical protein
MPKPDQVLRKRPLVEVAKLVETLKRVVLFHASTIATEKPFKMCICNKPPRKEGQRGVIDGVSVELTLDSLNCDDCWLWCHRDCVGVSEAEFARIRDNNEKWLCHYCRGAIDKEGYQRWDYHRGKAKKRHINDTPRARGENPDEEREKVWSGPVTRDQKTAEIQEISRRNGIKKRKLKDMVAEAVDKGQHHLTDAEGMAGLENRGVDDAMIEDAIEAGLIDINAVEDE